MKTLFIFLLLPAALVVYPQQPVFSVDTIHIRSRILQEDRTILVYKPLKMRSDDPLNFIYLLDGEFANYRYNALQSRFGYSISDLIAVGIINTDRRRDLLYVNRAGQFLKFLTEVLIPAMEQNFKVRKRILYGHSFAGSFVIYSLLKRPDAFDGFIASSPTPIMALTNRDDYLKTDSILKGEKMLHLSYGSRDMRQVRKWTKLLADNLTGTEFEHLVWKCEVYEGKDHNNSDIPSLINGICFINE